MNRIYKFEDVGSMAIFLNGGLIGGDLSGGVGGLVGLTLTFTAPAFVVTFTTQAAAARDPYTLLIPDIKAQIEAANTLISVGQNAGRLILVEKAPSTGVALSSNNEVAKRLLGFDQVNPTVGKVFRPAAMAGGTPPFYSNVYASSNNHVLFTWE